MVVLDCSVLAEMQCNSEKGKAARSLICAGEKIVAPTLLYAEICSAIRKFALRGKIAAGNAPAFAAEAVDMVDEFVSMEDLYQEAVGESMRLRHSVYDMFYLVLARRVHATLFTFDARLRELCHDSGVECLEEVDWPGEGEEGGEGALQCP